jgi:serine/threonine protein kinase
MQHPFHLMPDMMVGPWRIKARLGAGGFGAVYRVEAEGEPYALKFAAHAPDSGDANRTDARAQRELACLLLIHHPNVVRVWAHGRWPHPTRGYHYVVMDYVEGPILADWVKLSQPTLRQVVRLFDTLALTLHALHSEGIHHRDLKSANILVRALDGAPVLVDFGAAEHATAAAAAVPLTEGPLPPGTPHLRTPEALRFHREQYNNPQAHYTFRPTDDLYALGATLYEVLTGAPPFPPSVPRDILLSLIETKMPVSPAATNPSVPPALADLVLRLLAKRPEDRPANGRALHEAFQALLSEGAAALDQPLAPSSDTVTTEGTGGPPPALRGADTSGGADTPERPLLPNEAATSEASAPTVLEVRASPGLSPPPSSWRPWRWRVGALVLLTVLSAALWRLAANTVGPTGPSSPLANPEASPPLISPDGGLPLYAEALPDAGSFTASPFHEPSVFEPPTSPQEKQSMRKASAKNSPFSLPPEPARDGGTRAPALASLLVTCTLVGGCASTPTGRPDNVPCPPGARAVMEKEFGIRNLAKDEVYLPGNLRGDDFEEGDFVTISEGRNFVVTHGDEWRKVPPGSKLIGEFYYRERLYGRFTELELPNKERRPFCGMLFDWHDGLAGMQILPGSKPGAIRVFPAAWVSPEKFEH